MNTQYFTNPLRSLLYLVAIVIMIVTSTASFAASATDGKQPIKQEATQPPTQNQTPDKQRQSALVSVDRQGTDTMGATLGLQLQDIFNKSTLFTLTTKDGPQIRLILTTVPEFETRPQIGSAYAAVWLYYENPTSFSTYLASEAGVVSPENVLAVATALAEKTLGIAVKHSYLFEPKQ